MPREKQTEEQKMEAMEAKWKAERDASTVAEAAAIRADPQRLSAAKVEAKRMQGEENQRAKEATARATSMGKLAKEKKAGNPKPAAKAKPKAKTAAKPRPKPKAKPKPKASPKPKAKPKGYGAKKKR